jgi:hypothetical protein
VRSDPAAFAAKIMLAVDSVAGLVQEKHGVLLGLARRLKSNIT